jgi:2-dehydro-3-deoxygluconokinase
MSGGLVANETVVGGFPAPSFDVLALGETMAMLAPTDAKSLATTNALTLDIGGAESNVAMHLAASGHSVAWASRLGDDPFGTRILATVAAAGVDVSLVVTDPLAPTGVYFKDPSHSRVHYYRAGSAASQMSTEWVDSLPITSARMVHLSGITPALSPTCAAVVDHLLNVARDRGVPVSFDVNYRAPLWSVAHAAPILAGFAARADVVFVGRDEAEVLWGTATAAAIRQLLAKPERLVVKDADIGATEFIGETETFVASPVVSVVEPVGAGDAFAAGYLSALLRGSTSRESLEHGHSLAAIALGSVLDFPGKD